MNIKLRITLRECEGALIRLLGTIERRGHALVNLSSRPAGSASAARNLSLDVDCGGRNPDILVRQIRRLYDVVEAAWYQLPEYQAADAHMSYEATSPAMYGMVVHRRENNAAAEGGQARPGVGANG